MISGSVALRFARFEIFKWFGCQLIWDLIGLVANVFEIKKFQTQSDWAAVHTRWDPSDEIQKISDSVALRFKWLASRSIWDSLDVRFNWFETQWMWKSKMKLWTSKTKLFCKTSFKNEILNLKTELFCETSFKNEALKLKNEAFLRDFLQTSNFEAQKSLVFARFPSKITCWPEVDLRIAIRFGDWTLQKHCACHETS